MVESLQDIKGREERTGLSMYIMGIYGNDTAVLWLGKETSFQKIRTEREGRRRSQRWPLPLETPSLFYQLPEQN